MPAVYTPKQIRKFDEHLKRPVALKLSLYARVCLAFNVFIGRYDALDWNASCEPSWTLKCPHCNDWKDQSHIIQGRIKFVDEDDGSIILMCKDCGKDSYWIDGPGILIPICKTPLETQASC
jgi:hypothetical protein